MTTRTRGKHQHQHRSQSQSKFKFKFQIQHQLGQLYFCIVHAALDGIRPRTRTPDPSPSRRPLRRWSTNEMQTSEISSNAIFKTRTAGQNVACCGRLATVPHAASFCFSFQTMRNALENTCFCVFGFSDRKCCCCLCRHMFEYTWKSNSADQVTDTRWALKQIYRARNESWFNSLRCTL